MKHTNSLFLVALLALLPGCGDDGGGGPVDAGPVDQCLSMSDMDLLSTPVGDAGVPPDPTGIGGNCATQSCLDELLNGTLEESAACMAGCWASSDLAGLSDGCRDCYLEATNCAGLRCAVPCFAGSGDCLTCIEEFCAPRTDDCTGL